MLIKNGTTLYSVFCTLPFFHLTGDHFLSFLIAPPCTYCRVFHCKNCQNILVHYHLGVGTEVFNALSPKMSFLSSSLKDQLIFFKLLPQFEVVILSVRLFQPGTLKVSLSHFPPAFHMSHRPVGYVISRSLPDVSACLLPTAITVT